VTQPRALVLDRNARRDNDVPAIRASAGQSAIVDEPVVRVVIHNGLFICSVELDARGVEDLLGVIAIAAEEAWG